MTLWGIKMNVHWCGKFFLLALVLLFMAGCGTLRGIPSHGGGKRFSIEQELVSATVRAAAKGLDVSAIRGRRAAIFIAAIGDTGAGNLVGGRLSLGALLRGQSINSPVTEEVNEYPVFDTTSVSSTQSSDRGSSRTGASSSDSAVTTSGATTTTTVGESESSSKTSTNSSGSSRTVTTTRSVLNAPERKITRTNDGGHDLSVSAGYAGIGGFDNSLVVVPRDSQFLNAIIQNYMVLKGVAVVAPDAAEVDVYITVDVFGTNRSRTDWLFANSESLKAKTAFELSAIERASGRVLISPQVSSYEAEYVEKFALWMGPYRTGKQVRKAGGLMVDFSDVLE
ncbi:MAG: adhesin [Proteobacteria bacterium]|nr:MAG: adhesin [Pseudomonadota bacterium]